jgi:DNA primase
MADDLLRGDHLPLGSKRDKSGEAEQNPDAEANIKLFTTALRLLRLRPKLDEALAIATNKASSDITDENFAEQQRLRREKEDFDRQIAALVQREAD